MKYSVYAKTALASLLALCSFNSFSIDIVNENAKKQQEDTIIINSEKTEFIKKSNKKLKERIDKVCNFDQEKNIIENKKRDNKKKISLFKKKKVKLVNEKKIKVVNFNSNSIGSKIENNKNNTKIKIIDENLDDIKFGYVNSTTNNDEDISVNGLRITFGGVVNVQSYNFIDINKYNFFFKKSEDFYGNIDDQKKERLEEDMRYNIQKYNNSIKDKNETVGMISDAILHLRAENKNEDLGIVYGADIQFQIPVTENKSVLQGFNAAKSRGTHLFLNSKYGDLKIGYQFGPEVLMRLDATRIATVDGATDSNWFKKVNLEKMDDNFSSSSSFYVTPHLYTESISTGNKKIPFSVTEKYNKDIFTKLPFRIAYYSPNFMGINFAISYSPKYDNSLFFIRENGGDIRNISPNYEHIISAGTTYKYNFIKKNVKIKTSFVGEYGKAKKTSNNSGIYKEFIEYNDLMGVNLALLADYKINCDNSLKFAASLAYLDKSGQSKNNIILNDDNKYDNKNVNGDDNIINKRIKNLGNKIESYDGTMYWTGGAGYQYKKFYTSLTYFGSKMDNSKLHDFIIGTQYELSPAYSKSKFVPYATLHYFMTNSKKNQSMLSSKEEAVVNNINSTKNNFYNKGFLFLTGIKFSF